MTAVAKVDVRERHEVTAHAKRTSKQETAVEEEQANIPRSRDGTPGNASCNDS
jgi:hypothetical protein